MSRLSLIITFFIGFIVTPPANAVDPFAKWEKSIVAFEEADKKDSPPADPVLFVGSSSIRMWDLDKSFPELNTLNRGFGGSTIADSIHFFDRIIKPYNPKLIVVYAGDNDMAKSPKGLTPKEVLADFKTLAAKIESSLPGTPLIYIAIKPSIKRKKLWPEMKQANDLIATYCAQKPNLVFADIAKPMLDQSLSPDLFKADGLHLTDKGYALWKDVITPLINHIQ